MTKPAELKVLIVDKTTNLELALRYDIEKGVELINADSIDSVIESMKQAQPPHIVICVCKFNIHSIGIDAIKMICDKFDDPTEQYLKPHILAIGPNLSRKNATEAGADDFILDLNGIDIFKNLVHYIKRFKMGFRLAVRRHYYENYLRIIPEPTENKTDFDAIGE